MPSRDLESTLQEYAGDRDMERFWREVEPRREPLQKRWFLPAVLFLLVVSVPWYLPAGSMGRFLWGLPVWMWTALGASVGIAAVTAYMALYAWDDDQQ